MKVFKGRILTVPNVLSVFRILLLPFFVWTYLKAETQSEYYISLIFLGVSGLTDLFDGFIARHFNQISELGKFLDPLADKLTQAAVVLCLSVRYPLMIIFFGVMVIKEFSLLTGSILLFKYRGRKMDGAKWYGKVYTFIFYFVFFAMILFPNMSVPLRNTLIFVCIGLGVFACVMYLLEIRRLWKLPPLTEEEAAV